MLLEELLLAGLNAPGFSERQRWELVTLADWAGDKIQMSPLCRIWPFEVLGRRAGVAEDVVEVSLSLIHPLCLLRVVGLPATPVHETFLSSQASNPLLFPVFIALFPTLENKD